MVNTVRTINTQNPSTPVLQNRLLRKPQVKELTGVSYSHMYQLIAEGKFPQPRKLVPGGRASAWVESEIREWIEERIASSTPTDSVA